MNKRRISMMAIFTLMILAVMACETSTPLDSGQPFGTPSPYNREALQSAYAAAQATQASGQSQMMDLSHQATVVSLNIAQAADAAAQATLDDNQRQLMELSVQANQIKQNMAYAAATQKFVLEQTQIAQNVTATAQSGAVTEYARQTAQAQSLLDVQAMNTAQANATRTAYSLTATPGAVIQADILRTRNEAERRAVWEEFVVTPLKIILPTLVVLLLIVGGVMAYLRLMPALEQRLRNGASVDSDQRLTNLELHLLNHPQLLSDEAVDVEIVGSSEPAITNWIIEAERQLRSDGKMQS